MVLINNCRVGCSEGRPYFCQPLVGKSRGCEGAKERSKVCEWMVWGRFFYQLAIGCWRVVHAKCLPWLWFSGLTEKQVECLEILQRKAFRIILTSVIAEFTHTLISVFY